MTVLSAVDFPVILDGQFTSSPCNLKIYFNSLAKLNKKFLLCSLWQSENTNDVIGTYRPVQVMSYNLTFSIQVFI
jgi:hypothetical protein